MRVRAKAKVAIYFVLLGFSVTALGFVAAAPAKDEAHPLAVEGYATVTDMGDWTWERERRVTMRDGIELSIDILLPKNRDVQLPTILVRSPYNIVNTDWAFFGPWHRKFLANGYAIVIQN